MILALACGQSTHIWTALHALEHLEAGSELEALLSDPTVHGALVSGTMFPDGGYSPTVAHPYGEAAHWEPFQVALLEQHVRTSTDPRELVFLLGLVAHGVGDQLFDAMYLYRSRVLDDWASLGPEASVDTDTDVVMASLVGGWPPNDHFVPYDALVPVFADQGVDVDVATMERGMGALDIAVAFVGAAAQLPDEVAAAEGRYPWASGHLLDAEVPGSPPCIGEAIASYWEVWLDRLHDRPLDDRLLASWPADGAHVAPREAGDVEGLVSALLARAARPEELSVEVTDDEGAQVPADAWLYYGADSNVVNVLPVDGWAQDRDYRVIVRLGGVEAGAFGFSTRPLPAPGPEGVAEEASGCGCASASGSGWLGALASWPIRRRTARAAW